MAPTRADRGPVMDLLCLGVNHRSAPVEVRERVAFGAPAIAEDLAKVRALPGVREVVLLSTCNRVELYAVGSEMQVVPELTAFLHARHDLPPGLLDPHLFTLTAEDAARHLFRVACSLDALVVGEPQILGQVKDAFRAALEARTLGPVLTRAFHRAFGVAKRVRTQTGIAQSAVSVSFAAVELARTIFGSLQGALCLLVGAGNMGELAARHFVQEGAELWLCNRSFERAQVLAQGFGGTARTLADLPMLLEKADVVLTSTAAPGFLVTPALLPAVMRARRYRPLFLVDIAVPRNVDPKCTDVENVYVYDVDDLARVVDKNKEKRQREAQRAEVLVTQEVDGLRQWWAGQAVVPIIKALRHKAETVVAAELARTLPGLPPELTDRQLRSITSMANAVVSKLLHDPIAALKSMPPESTEAHDLATAAQRLFALEMANGHGDDSAASDEMARQALAVAEEAEAQAPPPAEGA